MSELMTGTAWDPSTKPVIRKNWEFLAILHVLKYHNVLGPGKRGLGFGVGEEPLASYFVKQGSEVVVSDAPQSGGWASEHQHAAQLKQTWATNIVDYETYARHAVFRAVDMNDIPSDLLTGDFDFTWSAGSLEHVGGQDKSVAFILNQMRALKSGGIAAHTTEFMISLDAPNNIELPWMTVFTKTVWQNRVIDQLTAHGYEVMGPVVWSVGRDPSPVDEPPYRSNHHFNLAVKFQHAPERWGIHTSGLLIVRKP